ncbi:MAG: radical SAM protein [Dehalococcoidales bacterium]|nr:radical SAM protein [Dehalococcoidales bacterium]
MWDRTNKARIAGAAPGQKLLLEQGTIIKDWGGQLPVALIYPNSYYLGMSNLGVQAIYSLLNRQSGIVCERVFLEQGKAPQSVESQRPLTDFAVLAFSVSYEPDYFNVARVLKASGIPLYASQRNSSHPLVIAGGACITANPAPLSPYFDAMCIGEAEPILPSVLPVLSEGIGGNRDELLKTLASLPGMYVPRYYSGTPVVRQWAKALDDFPVASAVMTPDTELGDLYLMEVERGCAWGCRFCLVCTAFSPIRFRSLDKLLEQARIGLNYRKRIGLVGPAVSDHPQIGELLSGLRQLGAELSFSSLRISSLTPTLWEEIARCGVKTITLAPEAGSERLRKVIKKGISEADILGALNIAAEKGIRQLKLYFMTGLPTETDEDTEEIINLALTAKGILDKSGARLTINISPFVPKPGTPFQWFHMAPVETLDRRIEHIKNRLAKKGIKLNYEGPAWSEVQAVLSRGDARIAEVLADMEAWSLPAWRRAVKKFDLDVDFYAHQKWDTSRELPWSVVDSGMRLERLKGELSKALGEATPMPGT